MNFSQQTKRIQSGDNEACRELLRECCVTVYQRVYSAVGDKTRAREITRDVLREVYLALLGQRSQREWDAWVNDVATRHIMDELIVFVNRRPPMPDLPKSVEQQVIEKTEAEISAAMSAVEAQREETTEPEKQKKAVQSNPAKPRMSGWGVAGIVLCVLIALWILLGFAFVRMELPSCLDLGYSWFNSMVYPLFVV